MELQATSQSVNHKLAEELLNKLIKSQELGDIELFSSCFCHGAQVVNIGTDIDEYWQGWSEFYTYMKKMIKARNGLKITARNTQINIAESGNTAWYSQLIDTCIEAKNDPFSLEGFRHTGVMQMYDHQWKIVQSHVSAPLTEKPDIEESE
ncbi:hypothetical protein E9993_14425 [Labilibacter sediminis]|nr:hypothetical protein E9993_14425 [Labilibacter sediminis]